MARKVPKSQQRAANVVIAHVKDAHEFCTCVLTPVMRAARTVKWDLLSRARCMYCWKRLA